MKTFKALLISIVLFGLAVGCKTTQSKENMLSAAGFKMEQADSPQKVARLNSLPADKITPVQRNGTTYYTFPDPKYHVLYVGQEKEYQQYRKLRLQKQMADEQLSAAEMYDDAGWGYWGPWA